MPTPNYLALLGLVVLFAAIVSARKVDIKINLAGNDVDGFSAEEEFLQLGEEIVKTRYHGQIKGSGNDLKVFQTQRFTRDEDLVIHLQVPDGIYSVTLMFAETWDGAFQDGKRVFDVYLGSKPGGVVRVAENFDPFRSGGPAGPVRQKYDGIATYGGLTIALRPIKQNPQIAGIVVSGFSYSEPLLDELPTIAGEVSAEEDFSVLANIGPKSPIDPSILYDPSLNPKLKDTTGARAGGPITTSTSSRGRTSIHSQQNLFSSQGPVSGPGGSFSSSTSDSSAQKLHLSSSPSRSGYGYNSISGPPASHLPTSPGSYPRLGPRAGTVRLAVDTTDISRYRSDGNDKPKLKLQSKSLNFATSTRWGHRRHGRHLASIPADVEVKAPINGQGPSESIVPEQTAFASSPRERTSSNYISRPSQLGSLAPAYLENSATLQSTEKSDKGPIKDGQTGGYVGPMGTGITWSQHQLVTGKDNADRQNHNHEESERALYQAQTESIKSSSPFYPQSRDSLELASLNPISQQPTAIRSPGSRTQVMADLTHSVVYETNPRSQHQSSFADASESQIPAGRASQSQAEDGSSAVPFARLPGQQNQEQIRPRAGIVEQRYAARPTVQVDESALQENGMGRLGDVKDFDRSISSNGFDSQTEIPYQKLPDAVGLQGSGNVQLAEQDPLHSRSQGSPSTKVPRPMDMNLGRVRSTTSSPLNVRVEMPKALDDTSGLVKKGKSDSIEPVLRSVKALVGAAEAAHSAPSSLKVESGGNENYQAISSRSMVSASSEQLSENAIIPRILNTDMPNEQLSDSASSSRYRSTDYRPSSIASLNAPSPGVHNGNGKLDGFCLDNSTHCSCGMVEQTADAPEECLFVVDENVNPMVCITRPCSGKVVCACAPGASALCQRSVVKTILVRASPTSPEDTEDPTVVLCKRETLEDGVLILTPVIQ